MRALALVLLLTAPCTSALEVPELTGRVVDGAGVVSEAAETAITDRLAAHEAATSNQIVVLTIPALEGENLEAFATRVFRTWGLGQADRDNGILLLIAVADRSVRIEVGYGLEGALPDVTAASIIRSEIVPRFRAGDFDSGVLAAVSAIESAIAGEYVASDPPLEPVGWVVLLFFALGPLMLGWSGLIRQGPVARYVTFGIGLTLLGGLLVGSDPPEGAAVLLLGSLIVLFLVGDAWLSWTASGQAYRAHQHAKQAAFHRARASGASSVTVDGQTYTVPTSSGGDGGFSGGGGSSGGGGASGSW